MTIKIPRIVEALLRDLDTEATPAAALRAIEVIPDALRSQGARVNLFIGCILLA